LLEGRRDRERQGRTTVGQDRRGILLWLQNPPFSHSESVRVNARSFFRRHHASASSGPTIGQSVEALKRTKASEERVKILLALVDAYSKEKGDVAQRSRLRALATLTREPAFTRDPRELSTYAELVTLSRTTGERSAHLDAANRMRERLSRRPGDGGSVPDARPLLLRRATAGGGRALLLADAAQCEDAEQLGAVRDGRY
jgi:hypothetical protein